MTSTSILASGSDCGCGSTIWTRNETSIPSATSTGSGNTIGSASGSSCGCGSDCGSSSDPSESATWIWIWTLTLTLSGSSLCSCSDCGRGYRSYRCGCGFENGNGNENDCGSGFGTTSSSDCGCGCGCGNICRLPSRAIGLEEALPDHRGGICRPIRRRRHLDVREEEGRGPTRRTLLLRRAFDRDTDGAGRGDEGGCPCCGEDRPVPDLGLDRRTS